MHSNPLWSIWGLGVDMSEMKDLLERLEFAGIPLNNEISHAMEAVDPKDFTDFDLETFWNDGPVPFLQTDLGATRTISAPHMIVTLLHHLEVKLGQKIILVGSKAGYLAALLDKIVGRDGSVTIVEPHSEVREFTESRLEYYSPSGMIRIVEPRFIEDEGLCSKSVDRVLITGSVRSIPDWIGSLVHEGGFVLGPFGGPVHQRLVKKEKQSGEWLETDLGGVVFGPMDVAESEKGPLDPESLANHIEDVHGLINRLVEVDEETGRRVAELINSLRDLPPDLPTLNEDSTEDDILEHPVVDLLLSEMEWLGPLWPFLTDYLSLDLESPGSTEEGASYLFGGHEDLVP